MSLECANAHVPLALLDLLKDKDVLLGAIDVSTQHDRDPRRSSGRIREARHVETTHCGHQVWPEPWA